MLKQTLLLLIFGSAALASTTIPSHAEAVRLRVEPSITFRQSHTRMYPGPVAVPAPAPVHVVPGYRQPVRYVVDPYTNDLYPYIPPYESCGYIDYYSPYSYYYYPAYPTHYRTTGTDFGLKFKFK